MLNRPIFRFARPSDRKVNPRFAKSPCERRGFTMVELIFSVFIAGMSLMVMFRLVSFLQKNYTMGTVSLNQMQEARLALSYLRRDFGSASPFFLASDTVKVRMNPIKLDATPISDPSKSSPVQITPTELVFYRYVFDNPVGTLTTGLEQVSYTFDSAAKTLTRRSPTVTVTFSSIKNINFGMYVHKANPNVPILNVRLEVLDEKTPGSPQNAPPLELCTSITSAFLNSNLNNLGWSYSPSQK